MATTWRGIWLGCVLVSLVSCSSKPPVQVSLAPPPLAVEQTYQAGRVAFQEQRYDEAAVQFARVVAAEPEHLKARLNWAAAMSANNRAAEAIIQCQNVLARDPTIAEAYYQWGAALARLSRHQEALEKFDQALALKPMEMLLQDDPTLQQSLQAYMKRQRRRAAEDAAIKMSVPRPPVRQ